MDIKLVNIGLSFVEGFALIVSPCILPILPIILAGSLTGSKKRPVGIILGFVFTFALFSYFAHSLILYMGINPNIIRRVSYLLLLFFAVVLISTPLTEWFAGLTSKLSTLNFYIKKRNGDDFISGLWLGALVSLIWTPCAGPLLAAVIVQIAIQSENIISFLMLLFFALGAATPMFIIVFSSMRLKDSFLFFKTHALSFRKAMGIIMILNVAFMVMQELGYRSSPVFSKVGIRTTNYLQDALWRPYPAPKIEGISEWINSPPLKISQFKGKVVLVDFWTYSCINCVRTLPFLKYLYKNYHLQGLEIIGVHSPEFDFEKDLSNVNRAVKTYGIQYPVALDNQYRTWRNFSNHYWPASYLINKQGMVVYEHFGEGQYDTLENNIRFLLGKEYMPNPSVSPSVPASFLTPETYLGYARAELNINANFSADKTVTYSYPMQLKTNQWALQGDWLVKANKIVSMKPNAALKISFNARFVYIVMGSSNKEGNKVNFLLNNKPLRMEQGTDVVNSQLYVTNYSIYNVIALPRMKAGVLEVISNTPGLEIYTFTFGD